MNEVPPSVEHSPEEDGGVPSSRSFPRFTWLLFLIPVLALGVGLMLFFTIRSVSFPTFPEGLYGGTLTLAGAPAPYPFIIEQSEGKEIVLSVLLPGWTPSRFSIGGGQGDIFEAILQSPEGLQFKLSGTLTEKGGASGLATDLNGDIRGSWIVTRAADDKEPEISEISLLHALLLRAEYAGLRDALKSVESEIKQIHEARVVIEQRQSNTEALTRAVEERRVALTQSESKLLSQIETLSTDAAALRGQLELSLSLTSAGKLVTLARQSLERETQWASLVAFSSPFSDATLNDLRDQYRQTLEIEKLQQRASELGIDSDVSVPHEGEQTSTPSGDAFGSIWEER